MWSVKVALGWHLKKLAATLKSNLETKTYKEKVAGGTYFLPIRKKKINKYFYIYISLEAVPPCHQCHPSEAKAASRKALQPVTLENGGATLVPPFANLWEELTSAGI